jgi:hypothetical protein
MSIINAQHGKKCAYLIESYIMREAISKCPVVDPVELALSTSSTSSDDDVKLDD